MPYCNRDPKRDHNFDNHLLSVWGLAFRAQGLAFSTLSCIGLGAVLQLGYAKVSLLESKVLSFRVQASEGKNGVSWLKRYRNL